MNVRTFLRLVTAALLLISLLSSIQSQTSTTGNSASDSGPPRIVEFPVSPLRVPVGGFVSARFTAERAIRETIDFGFGPTDVQVFSYSTFGVKQITAVAINDSGAVYLRRIVTVEGLFVPHLDLTIAPHNAKWAPVTTGEILGLGSYDEIRGYYRGDEVFSVPATERYEIPIPFVGSRNIELKLFESGMPVTSGVIVELTGTNQPPSKPTYEGPALVSVDAGTKVEFSILTDEPNDDPVRFEASPLPEGASVGKNTGLFTWTPGNAQVGYHLINFYAFDVPYETRDAFAQRTILVVR